MRWIGGAVAGLMMLVSANTARADAQGFENSIKRSIRNFTAFVAPEATAEQTRHYGLFCPSKLDPAKPLVVLIHGLDMTPSNFKSMSDRLWAAGFQVGLFCYPEDQPIADDVRMLRDRMAVLRTEHPKQTVDIVAFSMGSLVARGYVEGPDYTGGVDRLILLGPPNHGSQWARLTWLAKLHEQACLWWYDPQWHPSWFITSGLCEAGRDLLPDSKFLTELNSRPRRAGVKYTIVEGDEHPARRLAAAAIDGTIRIIPKRVVGWQTGKVMQLAMRVESASLRAQRGDSDGPVSFDSAGLPGVSDVVRVHADHETMIDADGDNPPPVWAIVRDRLAR
jgi:pimeloyl-ACP methyl ester carboxylesterase